MLNISKYSKLLQSFEDGTTRFYVDYRKLNAITRKDAYPLPHIDESLYSLYLRVEGSVFKTVGMCYNIK